MAEPDLLAAAAENDNIEAELLVLEKSLQTTKSGSAYLALVLGDAGGKIDGRIWERAESLDKAFDSGDVVRVRGRISSYQGRRQIVVNSLEALDRENLEMARFMPAAQRSEQEMLDQLDALVESLAQPLGGLCEAIFGDREFRELFRTAPAAKSVHHDYLSGLLEHTLSVAEMAELVAGKYPYLHRDLLLTGALLHDIGKAYELTLNPGPDYTTPGRLVGHVVQGVEIMRDHLPQDFPPGLADELIHMILSHHGLLEYGSPKTPQTLEAAALNFCDEIDAKLTATKNLLDETDGDWTGYNRLFERFFYKGSEDRPEQEEAPKKPRQEKPRKKAEKPKQEEATPGLFGEG